MKSLKSNILCNLLPILIGLFLFIYYTSPAYQSFFRKFMEPFEIILYSGTPFYLLIINIMYSIKHKKIIFINRMILMMIVESILVFISYVNWGIYTDRLFQPGSTNEFYLRLNMQIVLSIITFVSLIFQTIMYIKYLRQKRVQPPKTQ